jgi:uncharacterized membrane protein
MSLRIGTALREGARRTFTRDGLVLAVVFVVIGIVSTISFLTLLANGIDGLLELMRANQGTGDAEFALEQIRAVESVADALDPLTLPVSSAVAWLLVALTAVLAEAVNIVAVRAFFADSGRALSGSLVRRNLPLATLNGVVGGIIVNIVVAIGLLFLIVPGIFFAIAFLFLRQEIAIEDQNFVDALADSWQLTKGNRLELFALVLGVAILVAIVTRVPPLLFGTVSPTASILVSILVGGVTTVFGTAVITRAYAQLHADRAAVQNGETDTDEWAV